MSGFGKARRAVIVGSRAARVALRDNEAQTVVCSRYSGAYMCQLQKEAPREPCDRCPNNPANIRRRLDRIEGIAVSGNEEETGC